MAFESVAGIQFGKVRACAAAAALTGLQINMMENEIDGIELQRFPVLGFKAAESLHVREALATAADPNCAGRAVQRRL